MMDDFVYPKESLRISILSHKKANLSWQNQDRKLSPMQSPTVLRKINFLCSYSLEQHFHLSDAFTDEVQP